MRMTAKMNRLVAETNFYNQSFREFPDIDIWIETALSSVSKANNLKIAPNGDIGLLLTSNAEIQKLNHNFRQQDKPTNVLSFPADADDNDDLFAQEDDEVYLGDIAMAYETLMAEAAAQNKPIKHHFIHLLIHSILHLLGYDHIEEDEAIEMESIEIKLLTMINIENPYQ